MSKANELLSRYLYKKEDDKTLWAETLNYLNRKDKLVVGSEWICDVSCYGGFCLNYVGVINVVDKITEDDVWFTNDDEMPIDQFLACFSPIEKESEE